MRIIWHGHSCFEIGDGETTVVIDPHDGRSLGINPPTASANVVLVTCDRYDHNSSRSIRGDHSTHVERAGRFSDHGIDFEGFPDVSDVVKGKMFGPNVIYRFEMDGVSIGHCGGICNYPSKEIIDGMKGVDILIVPVGEVSTLDLDSTFMLIAEISPKVVVPMHYRVCGLSLPLKGLDGFTERIDAPIDHVGSEIDIFFEELPDTTEFWIFSR